MNGSLSAYTGLPEVPRGVHVWVWGMFAAVTLACIGVYCVYGARNVWDGWPESAELHHPEYGERMYLDSVFRTRANTWSNLAYVLVGLYAIAIGISDGRRGARARDGYLRQRPALGILYGAACCYLGFGSGIFHASLTYWGQQLDVAAMYSPLVVLIALNLDRRFPMWPVWGVGAMAASALLYVYKWSMSSSVVLPALIATVGIFGILDRFRSGRRMNMGWLGSAFAALIVAVFFRQIDVARRFTGPDAWMQGHVLWHVFTGLCLGCMYLYYRSEVVTSPNATPDGANNGATGKEE